MVSQVCEHCGARVAGDEQFCTDCGGFVDPMSARRSSGGPNVISVTSDGPYEEFSLDSEPPPEAPPRREAAARTRSSRTVPCPSCGAENPAHNRHCQECGARLQQGPLPTAPRPAVQATAGVRAALGISGLLFLVILIALFFNLVNDDEVAAVTTIDATATTQAPLAEPAPIQILAAECTPEGIGAFSCSNLYSGTDMEYQVDWEELEATEQSVTIRLLFSEHMNVSQIVWGNITDDTRFLQNFRARGLTINAQGSLSPVHQELEDLPGQQNVNYIALNATWIEITIESAYRAQVVNDNVFGELAIDEITVIGRPANPVTNTTSGG